MYSDKNTAIPLFPAFLNLNGVPCLVVGGGTSALRRVRELLRAGARVTLVAPWLDPGFADLENGPAVRHLAMRFTRAMVAGQRLVIAATDDPDVNREVADSARVAGAWVNVVDDPAACTLVAAATVERPPVTVAVSTSGTSPTLARELKAFLEAVLPRNLGELGRLAASIRPRVKGALAPGPSRRRFWERMLQSEAATLALDGRREQAEHQASRLLAESAEARPLSGEAAPGHLALEQSSGSGVVYLVGAGPGDPSLLTLRALSLMQLADVVLHDELVSPEVLVLARADAPRIAVGRRRGAHRMSRDALDALMVRLAGKGLRVLRLKGGDPLIFARGGEEMAALREAGIRFEVVPGVTAAQGAAAAYGIPLTHRDLAHSCLIAAGELAKEESKSEAVPEASAKQTIVIYMPLGRLAETCRGLIGRGLAPSTPAALVSKATLSDERVVVATLGSIAAEAHQIEPPALLIVGEVVRLSGALSHGEKSTSSGSASDDMVGLWRLWLTHCRPMSGDEAAPRAI